MSNMYRACVCDDDNLNVERRKSGDSGCELSVKIVPFVK
jgi:hypothetical protein